MSKDEHLLQPGREHLERRKDEIEKLLKGAGRYELHRQGRKSIVLDRDDLKKQLKEIKVMIKAQQKFDKKTDPMIENRKAIRNELMQLSKSEIADMYLNLRYSEVMIKQFHMPVYQRGLMHEKKLLENQRAAAVERKKNNLNKLRDKLVKAGITISDSTTVAGLRRQAENKIELTSDDKTLRRQLVAIKKGS